MGGPVFGGVAKQLAGLGHAVEVTGCLGPQVAQLPMAVWDNGGQCLRITTCPSAAA